MVISSMASVRFYIEKRRDENGMLRTRQVPILLFFSFDGKRLQLNTGERVDSSEWDPENQRLRTDAPGSKHVNRYLDSLSEEVIAIYREARETGIRHGPAYIREQIRYRRRKENIEFFDVLMRFINENHSSWSIHTFRKVRTTYNHIRAFSLAEQTDIDFNRIDHAFLDRYIRFFIVKYNHSNTTISKNISVLKWFLNWATEKGYNKSNLYRDYRLSWEARPKLGETDRVLDWEELSMLSKYKPKERNLREVRDIFCFMCYSGLKLARIYQLSTSNIFPEYVRMPLKEGGQYYNLPINRYASAILTEYNDKESAGGSCFPHYNNSYFNQLLKKLGRSAGLNTYIRIEVLSGNEKGVRQVPKYEVLTAGMAVNTFLYNGLKLRVSSEVLTYITDQKTLSGVERIRTMLEHSAFSDMKKYDDLEG